MTEGKILLVGFVPGASEHMTYRARAAIAEADVVIGYSTYIKLVQDLLDGKAVVRKGMTEEIDRCVEAYAQARQGKTVALISSGDIGVYGMAGPTFEVLLQAGWTPASGIAVEVIPGATALNACAALVGAPLTHDFCSISLSDLLTPWPVILRRLEAAARGDFVVALYNPRSGRRARQIVEAQRILLRHRRPDTPVAIVKSAYRRRQNIRMTTLDAMADCDIGMLCTVLVGNRATFLREGLMITPRGYANKYDGLTGPEKGGEQPGRSLGMGLAGWHGCVRRWLHEHPEANLRDAARHFEVPLGEILTAVSAGSEDEAAGDHGAWRVPRESLDALLDAIRGWGRLRAVVRGEGGTVAELLLDADELTRRGDWLNLVNPHCHLHADLSRVAGLWLHEREPANYGVWFLDEAGNPAFSLLLVKEGGAHADAALAAFRETRERLGQRIGSAEDDTDEEKNGDE